MNKLFRNLLFVVGGLLLSAVAFAQDKPENLCGGSGLSYHFNWPVYLCFFIRQENKQIRKGKRLIRRIAELRTKV
jgi:hypothetical protein